MSSRRAVVLAGGKGTRLRPYTVVLPKPLMPIGDYPILEIVVRQLAKQNYRHITMAVNHQAELIMAFFGTGSKWNVDIDYSLEDKPLSTIAPLKLIRDLPENFLVMNGDVLTDLDFTELYDFHVRSNNIFTIASFERDEISEYGVLEIDSRDRLVGFHEKPTSKLNVSMGVYVANRKMLDLIPPGLPYGFDSLVIDLIKCSNPPAVKKHRGIWLDIGRPDDYAKAIEVFENLSTTFLSDK